MESFSDVMARCRDKLRGAKVPDVPVQCATCRDTKWVASIDANGHERLRRCACVKLSIPVLVNAPHEFADATLATFVRTPENEATVRQVEAWASGSRDLFLWGLVGTGKTRLACSVVRDLCRPARFELVETLLRALIREDDEGERWRHVVAVPVLILDDVGTTESDWSRRTLTTIYSERLAQQRRTVFTSNLSVGELVKRWDDERLGSRVAGAADVVNVVGADYRRRRR